MSSDGKASIDAGTIAGQPPTGVVAMRSIPDVIAAPPGFFAYQPVAARRGRFGPR